MGTVIAATVMASVAGFALAPPAQAGYSECVAYLEGAGYGMNGLRRDACIAGDSSQAGGWFLCWDGLMDTGIPSGVASEACDRAGR
ncbi:hypothetical protein ACIBQX_45455 [Nonomuraea sp. NPDC049714]|uniref:hypothetical protein n=1 Tax=Nonomuraea sp. NPDC049714 TaxID=3364357 RepID=UPI0037A7FE59